MRSNNKFCVPKLYIALLIISLGIPLSGYAQKVALKTNLLYDIATTLNAGVEFGLSPQWSLEVPFNFNPWSFPDNKQVKHWLVQPELRYWFCDRFEGHFLGLHLHTGQYNVSGIDVFGLHPDFRYEGMLYGAGISYGYQWILNNRWSIEATLGVGYTLFDYAKHKCLDCAPKEGDFKKNYFGPTRFGLSIIYYIQ